jgi:hypothetical protein
MIAACDFFDGRQREMNLLFETGCNETNEVAAAAINDILNKKRNRIWDTLAATK